MTMGASGSLCPRAPGSHNALPGAFRLYTGPCHFRRFAIAPAMASPPAIIGRSKGSASSSLAGDIAVG